MQTKPMPTEGKNSDKLEAESALRGAACCALLFRVRKRRWQVAADKGNSARTPWEDITPWILLKVGLREVIRFALLGQSQSWMPRLSRPIESLLRFRLRNGLCDSCSGSLGQAAGERPSRRTATDLQSEADMGGSKERLSSDGIILHNVRVDAPAVGSPNSNYRLIAGCISRLVRFGFCC